MSQAPLPNVLFFKTETDGHPLGYSYITIATDPITIHPGDCLEYDIYIDMSSPVSQAGVDMHFLSGRAMRDSMVFDQQDMWSHPMTNLYDAVDTWYHRKMALTNLVGETVESVQIAVVSPVPGTYIACYKNIVITRDGQVIHSFYREGDPKVVAVKMRLGFFNDVVQAIQWENFRRVKLEHIEPTKISPEIQLAEKLLHLYDDQKELWLPLIDRAKKTLDIAKYIENDDQGFNKSLAEVGQILAPILRQVKNFTIHFIGHAHIDMNWLWVWNETVAVCQRDFETMTKLMEKYRFFTFSQSQVSVYKAVMKTRPDLFDRIREFVNKGQWEITAAMWVEGDENMAAGESVVRQFLLAHRFLKRHFGIEPKVCWQPDLFGHVWTMPQILKKCGVKYYYFMRCGKDNPHVFWWEAPDGSRVLAATTPNYNGSIGYDTANYGFELFRKQGIRDYMHVYGVGDHGGGPTVRDIERGLAIGANPYLPSIKFNTVENYFDTVAVRYPQIPVVRDELQFIFEGCYTTHADIKLRNRQCENLFPVLELFASLAMPFELPYPKFILDEGWERACFNQFHDILPGSAIHASYQEAIPITDGFLQSARQALHHSLMTLADQINTAGTDAEPIVVFNPSNWERQDVVAVTLPIFANEWPEIVDPDGQIIPSQVIDRQPDRATLMFIAEAVPSMGYKTYGWRKVEREPSYETDLKMYPNFRIENQNYRIQLDELTGQISSIVSKTDGKEFVRPGSRANRFQLLHEQPHDMSAWVIGPIAETTELATPERVEVLERGPIRILIQIVSRFRHSTFVQRVAIYSKLARIDFPCTVDWQELGSRHTGSLFLKVAFPVNLGANLRAHFELPFGTIERPANGHEYPTQKWLDLSDADHGVSLINDCKYGCDVHQTELRLSLLRCSYEPDPIPDRGTQHFTYALLPHQGDWRQANTLRAGYELNQPLMAILTDHHPGAWPLNQSFIHCSAENIIITSLKKCEDDDSLILRCYETHGQSVNARFHSAFKILMVEETDLLERNLESSNIEFMDNGFLAKIAPYEIRTFRLVREGINWPRRHNFVPV